MRFGCFVLVSFLLLCLAAPFARAQRKSIDPPIAGRPLDFSNIVGNYAIEASAAPLEVAVEEPITLTVRLTARGAVDPRYEPRRKELQVLPDWKNDFYVEPVSDEDRVDKDKRTWLFVYRLRPKHTNIQTIDGIKLAYYDPTAGAYARRYAPPIKNLVVKKKPDWTVEFETPIAASDSFWHIDESQAAIEIAPAEFQPTMANMGIAILVPPLVCALGVVVWRRMRPDEARERRNQRRAAAAQALASLRGNRASPWAIVCQYLQDRFDFAVDDPTPDDVGAFLRRRGFAKERGAMGHAFFAHCDAIRFAYSGKATTTLTEEAARLIDSLEADPCAR